jgi:PAS domain S-box-containing protein
MATEVNESNLGEKLEIARRRFDELYARSLSSPGELTLLPEALHELSTSIEELTATAEELKQQNEKLAAMRGLVEAERRHFQELFESAPDGYLVTDTRGIIQEANSNAAKLLHMRQDFLAGKPIIVYLPQPAHASFHQLLARFHQGDQVLSWETEMQPREGAAFHAALTVSAVRELSATDQRPVGLRWLIRDVTKRWTAEQQIETQLTRISVLRDINLAITSTLDLQTVLDVLLDRLALLFPYPIVTTVRLIVPETQKLAHIISRGLNRQEWQAHAPSSPAPRTEELLRRKLPVATRNVQTDPDSRSPDFYIRNGLVSYLGVPLTVQGEALGVLGLYTKGEHEFTKDEIDSVSSLAVQAAIAIHNSQLYEKLKSQTVELQKAHDDLELRVEERTSALAKTNEVLRSEVNERKQVEEKLRESEGRLMAFAHQLEDHLIANDRLISVGELSASIAHEFNNPLQIILGFAQNLIQEESFSEAWQQDLRIIEDEARRCRGIIRNLLDFARPTSNEPIPIVVDAIVRDSIKLVRGYLDKSNVATDIHIPQDLPSIRGDPQPLKQVLINLFFNAVDAMPAGGTLSVGAAADDDSHLTIAVTDTGQGIHPQTLPHIFRPFFTTKQKRGTGLGLSVCDRIIKAHGGSITVESSQEGGTTFFLHFPLMEGKSDDRVP